MSKRLTFSDEKLLKLPLENFISSIDYSWNEKWNNHPYSNEEKTSLIVEHLDRALHLRSDIVDAVLEKLIFLNNNNEISAELKELFQSRYKK